MSSYFQIKKRELINKGIRPNEAQEARLKEAYAAYEALPMRKPVDGIMRANPMAAEAWEAFMQMVEEIKSEHHEFQAEVRIKAIDIYSDEVAFAKLKRILAKEGFEII